LQFRAASTALCFSLLLLLPLGSRSFSSAEGEGAGDCSSFREKQQEVEIRSCRKSKNEAERKSKNEGAIPVRKSKAKLSFLDGKTKLAKAETEDRSEAAAFIVCKANFAFIKFKF